LRWLRPIGLLLGVLHAMTNMMHTISSNSACGSAIAWLRRRGGRGARRPSIIKRKPQRPCRACIGAHSKGTIVKTAEKTVLT
jgi:hypothetical protein